MPGSQQDQRAAKELLRSHPEEGSLPVVAEAGHIHPVAEEAGHIAGDRPAAVEVGSRLAVVGPVRT